MDATLYYINQPMESKIWHGIIMQIEFDSPSSITMPKGFFRSYYRILSKKELVNPKEIEESLEKIFFKYNQYSINPLATPKGQSILKGKGIRHTSMSVGDVIRVEKQYYIVAGEGFSKLKLV